MVLDSLLRLGFTEKEALVYWTLIRHGASHVSSLAERAALKRVTVYSILESLSQKGLVDHEDSQHGRRYRAQDPENLLYGIEQEKAAIQSKLEIARHCIEELQTPYERQHLSVRRFLHIKGKKRLEQILSEELSHDKKVLLIESPKPSTAKQFTTEWLFSQKKIFKKLSQVTAACSSTENAVLLMQEDLTFFIKSTDELDHSIEGLFIRDPAYVRFMKEGLLKPFLESEKVQKPTQPALL